jgi:DNA topoisomerase-1
MERRALIITEKPDAAQRIAQALDAGGTPRKVQKGVVPYFIVERDKKIIVAPAVGHLYTVTQATRRSDYPVFNYKWVPRYVAEKKANFTRSWIDTISHLAKNASEFIDACDYDIEGSLIGYFILKYACAGKENAAKRMKYSTLTETELKEAYEKPLAKLDFALIEAGLTRHEVDWLYGINLSRALTHAARRWSGGYANLSTGRVQGPTLRFLVTREREIGCHVPTPYWSIHAKVKVDEKFFVAEYEEKAIDRKAEADAVLQECNDKFGVIDQINTRKSQILPPIPFDLGALQVEAYRLFGYTPRRTSDVAQRLYLDALISYPRTNSQKLPPSIGYRRILNSLKSESSYEKLVSRLLSMKALKPSEGKGKDPAHPAIYPTGNRPQKHLDSSGSRIWDLIVRRFMAVFGEPALRQTVKVSIKVVGHRFFAYGVQVLFEGWTQFYQPYVNLVGTPLPPVEKGKKVDIVRMVSEDKFTTPPPRYNPSSLLRKMEAEGIGTKATRADMIETLYRRRYITEERIKVTDLGFGVTTILHKYCPSVVSVELTKDLEARMERVKSGEKREDVLAEAIAHLKPLLEEFKEKEEAIGKALSEAVRNAGLQERIISDCPTCKTGKLIVLRSRKTGKRFIGCTNYFKNQCKTSVPLPQRGMIKPTGRRCKICGWPTVIVTPEKGRPWRLCINPTCPKKENRRLAEMQSVQ